MHPEQIKAAIRMKETTALQIASDLNVCRMTISHVIYGRTISARIAKKIRQVTGLRIADMWPGKYPTLEFVERAGLQLTAEQAEADLCKASARTASTRKTGVAA